jgi:hypothetical protein
MAGLIEWLEQDYSAEVTSYASFDGGVEVSVRLYTDGLNAKAGQSPLYRIHDAS